MKKNEITFGMAINDVRVRPVLIQSYADVS